MYKKKRMKVSSVFLHLFFIVTLVVSIYPIALIFFNAVTPEQHLTEIGYVAWPETITFDAFSYLFGNAMPFLKAIWASVVYAIIGTIFSIIVEALFAYALTKDYFVLRKPLQYFLITTLFLGVGMIPHYMVNTQIYHLDNNWLVYILPGAMSAMGVFMFRTFFNSVPYELTESASIDGATDMQILWKVIVPLSLPIMVTQFFLNMATRWKDYTTSLYYITNQSMVTLEYYIQQIMNDATLLKQNAQLLGMDTSAYPIEGMRFAAVFFTLIPMVLIFPFMQKFFEKGAIAGSVKG